MEELKKSQDVTQKEEDEKKRRYYSWDLIMYEEDAVKKLCTEQCRNWAYAMHDKDLKEDGTPKEVHYHVIATFDQQKSFSTIVRLAKSYTSQNVRAKPIGDLGGAMAYLTHETEKAISEGKYQYDREIVKYSSKDFYSKYVKGEEISENELFVEDLLCPKEQFSVIKMAKRYGRDFIKNVKSYIDFRSMALAEMAGVNPLDYHYQAYSTEDTRAIQKNAEGVNSILKGE
jgi:hypothetical protein